MKNKKKEGQQDEWTRIKRPSPQSYPPPPYPVRATDSIKANQGETSLATWLAEYC